MGPWLIVAASWISIVVQAAFEVEHPRHWLNALGLSLSSQVRDCVTSSSAVPEKPVMEPKRRSREASSAAFKFIVVMKTSNRAQRAQGAYGAFGDKTIYVL
jgi:hypothetical protein